MLCASKIAYYIFIQVKHGNHVNTTDSLLAFIKECDRIDRNSVKIWYTEFKVSKPFINICLNDNVYLINNLTDLKSIIPHNLKNINNIDNIILRDYQNEIVNVSVKLIKRKKSGLVCIPPGTGKTITALNICNHFDNKKIGWITRRKELLINQFNDIIKFKNINIYNMLTRIGKTNPITKSGLYIINEDYFKKLIVSGLNILFDFIIIDECHEAGANIIFNIYNNLNIPKIGLSATPYTGDLIHTNNVKYLFPNIIYNMSIFDAIDNKYILPLTFWFRNNVKNSVLEAINYLTEKNGFVKIIGWVEKINKCNEYYNMFKNILKCYVSHSQNDSENNNIIKFKNDKNNSMLICVRKGREGFNVPEVNCVIYLTPVQKRAFNVSIQTGNRCNRMYPGKNKALVIDCIKRDIIEVLVRYYFNNGNKKLFKDVCNKLRQEGTKLYYKDIEILDFENSSHEFIDYKNELFTKFYELKTYNKFCEKFQHTIINEFDKTVIPNYTNYLIIHNKYPDEFIHDPQGIYKNLNWHKVFGNVMSNILNYNEFVKYCRIEFNKNYSGEMLYDFYENLYKKNNLLPHNPSDYYKDFSNYNKLFNYFE